ncbi:MAG: glycosyltransferase [Negativicutes bacterium]|nr:glycosyltransferase [Negativicutes bacterium]
MNPVVSIIVPVYKTESYLRKCLDSILRQTFTDYELLLIDDGSPDDCGLICDEYAQKDARIRVIHQENAGVSAARNVALAEARGVYVGFVDSDDWIEDDMFATLYAYIREFDADIAICGYWEIDANGHSVVNGDDKITVYPREEALRELLLDRDMRSFLWNKLYKAELFAGIKFGHRILSDYFILHKVFARANSIIQVNVPKYHYLKRYSSLTGNMNHMERYTAVCGAKERLIFIQEQFPQLVPYALVDLTTKAFEAWRKLIQGDINENRALLVSVENDLMEHFWDIMINPQNTANQKAAVLYIKLVNNLAMQKLIYVKLLAAFDPELRTLKN